ncbi:pyrroloquinoline quinone biosynthesis peptide chaperone PqqD [Azospirillum brasilense]|uniref:Pyrroloquinoline quinone biosynthesis peptide chaperone PqqD n=1 Tax=Azospirillum brasilense TaxID=192 RepID=A0A0P0F5S9_AZOBR|nr:MULTISPECIES: pyrroloquinoline quinone biosynthesis peptide chaperone PqqD [Azospirillum]ALJ35094.1 pyrroloquinoline quinone biosynthesis protein PqqD [Azospirillum brasilense]MDW7553591.1 pyrroloquinoline quinone biosynthesis peptide chaperone PqqD [Azospirillum brasilense]MDW7594203.1 pyrroloquinoline quinone biosynthesis peptide chaperone PqqD [Azospirillum brasilense]MDW7629075.1 pyrroloquinoline quinone biosynthesis peptide chaperone PqqD [Azospirillum brasilense]MDX5953782.1 pyrroloqu
MTDGVREEDRVRLAPGVMLRQDRVRGHWQLLGPERVLILDEVALEVVRAVTAQPPATVGTAITALAAQFDAPRDEIAADVLELLGDMIAKGFLTR